MSDWKQAEEQQNRDFLYIEELNSNDGVSKRLAGIPTSKTVEELKRSIAVELQNPNGWRNLVVAFAGQELSNDNATLGSYSVEDGDTIFFTRAVAPPTRTENEAPPPYAGEKVLNNVMFRDLDGKTLSLHFIPLAWKVKQLAEKLGQEKALEIEFYRFIWGGKQLEHEKTLEDYNLGENCTIHMVARLRGGM